MAGLTAFLRFNAHGRPLSEVLDQTLSVPPGRLPTKSIHLKTASSLVAIGGTYPDHFFNNKNCSANENTSLLFYGQLNLPFARGREADYVLETFESADAVALANLNGPFIAFAWNEKTEELSVIPDRLGRFPVFCCEVGNVNILTTDIHAVFETGILHPALDEESVANFLTIGFPLGNRSMFQGVTRLTGGTVWTFSRSGMSERHFWSPRFPSDADAHHGNIDEMVDAFGSATRRAIERWDRVALTLSGGWDSRATCAYVGRLQEPRVEAVSYGVRGSTDVELGAAVAGKTGMPHRRIEPERSFFETFDRWADDVVRHSGGHAFIDLAFQMYAYDRIQKDVPVVLDSAGCEFRRGIRAQRTAEQATSSKDVTRFLTSMYSTGIWNDSIMIREFFHKYHTTTADTLSRWLEALAPRAYSDQIDIFSTDQLWAHHYAHGYPLQTSFIACEMPFSDNEFYDLFSRAPSSIRWSHAFHHAVIHRSAPALETIPVCHGHCRVPYGESKIRYMPVVYHRLVSRAAALPGLSWLRSLDNYKPFRAYHHWYVNELHDYVYDMLGSDVVRSGGFLQHAGIENMLKEQKEKPVDRSHAISVLLTLAHLLRYVQAMRPRYNTSQLDH